ncbi:MAG TPA: TetR/AcrR family transcriptional regulator [Ktedonobacteraceae bacterium]|nr:TetR/AcrR family transcriptional regulator [Ktedonobacteraceae bacterium]
MNDESYSLDKHKEGRSGRKRARTRAELLAAARKVFAARGYHEASIAEITELADVGVGTFYLHFRDKDDAFGTLLDEGFQEMQSEIAAQLKATSKPSLSLTIMTVFRCAHSRRDLFQIALTARGQFARARLFRAQANLADHLAGALELASAEGLLEGFDVAVTARLITGMITQGIFWWFENKEPSPDAMAEQVLLLLRHGLPEQLFQEDKQV